MLDFAVTVERVGDNRRFRRAIRAADEDSAVREANRLLAAEPEDYYVLCAVPARREGG